MDRRDYYLDQLVTDLELDAGFDGAENADRNIVADAALIGVYSGLVAAQHGPTPDISVDVTAGTAYDPSGRRMRVPAPQTVSMLVDSNSVATAVVNGGNSKILGLFLKFKRLNSDPRTDGNANPINFVQAESYEFIIVQGAESVTPTAPATPADTIRLADITRTFGQTQILNAQIAVTNRKHAFEATSGALSVRKGTAPEAVQELLTLLGAHVVLAAGAHAASAIAYAGGGSWAGGTGPTNPAATVEAQLDKIVTDLAATTAGASGAHRVGMGAFANTWATGSPPTSTGTVYGNVNQIVLELGVNAGAGKVGFQPAGNVAAITVQAAIAELDSEKGGLATTNAWAAVNQFGARVDFNAELRLEAGAFVSWRVATLANASSTFTVSEDEYRIPNVTANRTYTLNNPTVNGRKVRFTKVGTGAFTITIERQDGTDLVVIPGGNDPYWVDIISDGGVWKISAAGGWAGIFSSFNATV